MRFLLTAKVNGNDAEAIGASLYEVGLVPDFEWLVQPEKAPTRLVRNRESVEKLTWSPRSERGSAWLVPSSFANTLIDAIHAVFDNAILNGPALVPRALKVQIRIVELPRHEPA